MGSAQLLLDPEALGQTPKGHKRYENPCMSVGVCKGSRLRPDMGCVREVGATRERTQVGGEVGSS